MTAQAFRLQAGTDLYVAIPAARAHAVAMLVEWGATEIARRDEISKPPWLLATLEILRAVDSEHLLSVAGSDFRTAEPSEQSAEASSSHDRILIADAARLTGWSAGYLCRLARRGLGRKRAGRWELDRAALLERLAAARGDAGGRGRQRPDPDLG